MTKAALAFRTISEVSETLDVPQHVLRFWEGKFPQVKPLKRAGGRRYYRPEDIDLLRGVRTLLYAEGYTIKGVQKVLRESGAKHVSEIGRYGPHRTARGEPENLWAEPPEFVKGPMSLPEGDADTDTHAPDDERDDATELSSRRAKLEAALTELLRLRDLLRAARPRKADAA
jgi:DNA-binding transcriptional MerR regulator